MKNIYIPPNDFIDSGFYSLNELIILGKNKINNKDFLTFLFDMLEE